MVASMGPARRRHLGDGAQAVRDIRELEACGRGQVAGELPGELWGYVTHGREHGHAAVLELRLAATGEVLRAAVRGEPGGVPEANRVLHAQLALEGAQRRASVERPVAP